MSLGQWDAPDGSGGLASRPTPEQPHAAARGPLVARLAGEGTAHPALPLPTSTQTSCVASSSKGHGQRGHAFTASRASAT
jgi:hypothetical protein